MRFDWRFDQRYDLDASKPSPQQMYHPAEEGQGLGTKMQKNRLPQILVEFIVVARVINTLFVNGIVLAGSLLSLLKGTLKD